MSAPPAVSVEEARALIREWVVFLDAESPDVWEAKNGKTRHVSQNAVPPFLRTLAKDAPLVVYTSHPQLDSSALVANTFRQQGYTNVKALSGGAGAWRQLGFQDDRGHVFPSAW